MATFIPTDNITGEVGDTELAFGAADGTLTSSEDLVFTSSSLRNKAASGSLTANQIISGYGAGPGVFRPYNGNDYSEYWGYDDATPDPLVLKLQIGRNNQNTANYRQAVLRAPLTIETQATDNADPKAPSNGNNRQLLDNVGLQIIARDTDTYEAPRIVLWKDGDNGVNGEEIGQIVFVGPSAGTNTDFDYARVGAEIIDRVGGSLDGALNFEIRQANSVRRVLKLTSTEAVFNEDQQDADFRIETTQSTNAFKLDGATGNISMRNSLGGIFTASSTGILVNSDTHADGDFRVITTKNSSAFHINSGTGDITMNGQYGEILKMDSSASAVELYKLILKDAGAGTTSEIYDDGFWFHINADTAGYLSANGFDVAFLNPNNSTGTNGLTYLNRIVTADLTSGDYTVGGGSVQLSGSLFKVTNAGTYTGVTLSSINGYMARVYNADASTSITVTPSSGTINNTSSVTVAPKKMLSAMCIGSGASAEWVLI